MQLHMKRSFSSSLQQKRNVDEESTKVEKRQTALLLKAKRGELLYLFVSFARLALLFAFHGYEIVYIVMVLN
jgi:hypothetical protein